MNNHPLRKGSNMYLPLSEIYAHTGIYIKGWSPRRKSSIAGKQKKVAAEVLEAGQKMPQLRTLATHDPISTDNARQGGGASLLDRLGGALSRELSRGPQAMPLKKKNGSTKTTARRQNQALTDMSAAKMPQGTEEPVVDKDIIIIDSRDDDGSTKALNNIGGHRGSNGSKRRKLKNDFDKQSEIVPDSELTLPPQDGRSMAVDNDVIMIDGNECGNKDLPIKPVIEGTPPNAVEQEKQSIPNNDNADWDGMIIFPEEMNSRSEFDWTYLEYSGITTDNINDALNAFDFRIHALQQEASKFELVYESTRKEIEHVTADSDEFASRMKQAITYKDIIDLALEHCSEVFVQQRGLQDEVEEGALKAIGGAVERAKIAFYGMIAEYDEKLRNLLAQINAGDAQKIMD